MKIQGMGHKMEVKIYEMGGISELRIVFSFVGSKACCSSFWRNGRYNLDQDVLPVDHTKITGSLCQYMLKTLSKISSTEVSEVIKAHIREVSRYIQLLVRIGYDKLTYELKHRIVLCLHDGIMMWKTLFEKLVAYEELELREQVKEISRYIIVLEVILQDFLYLSSNL